MLPPRLSVVVLTWNERETIDATLDALAAQTRRDFEVIVVDAASTDGTPQAVLTHVESFPVPLALVVAQRRLSIGEARNHGVARARASAVAFLSADAIPDPRWVERAERGVRRYDGVFGRQIHAPRRATTVADVRSLRYHFPTEDRADALPYASHVSAAFRKDLLLAFPFGASRSDSVVDDLLLARRVTASGRTLGYDPQMIVRHVDVDAARDEFAKNRREGFAWGAHARELGLNGTALVWAWLLALAFLMLLAVPSALTALAAVLALYVPALRRAWRRRRAMAPAAIVRGTLASPPFDLAFLVSYLAGLVAGRPRRRRSHAPAEARP